MACSKSISALLSCCQRAKAKVCLLRCIVAACLWPGVARCGPVWPGTAAVWAGYYVAHLGQTRLNFGLDVVECPQRQRPHIGGGLGAGYRRGFGGITEDSVRAGAAQVPRRQKTMAPDAGRKAAFTRYAGIGASDAILADAGALNLHRPSLRSRLQHNPLHRRLLHRLARIQQGEVLAIEPSIGQITIMRTVRVARLTRRIDGDRAIPMANVHHHAK